MRIWYAALSAAATFTVDAAVMPDPVFRVEFEGDAKAVVARGNPLPVRGGSYEFVQGLHGSALHVGSAAKTDLAYSAEGIYRRQRGTISFWFKPDSVGPQITIPGRRTFVQSDYHGERLGTGALLLWMVDGKVRGDLSDDADRYVTQADDLVPDRWNHIVFVWDGESCCVYVNGCRSAPKRSDSAGPLAMAYGKGKARGRLSGPYSFSRPCEPKMLFVGSNGYGQPMCGAMDDLRIWDVRLDEDQILSLRTDESSDRIVRMSPRPDYSTVFAGHVNAYERPPLAEAGLPGEMELVAEWTPGREVPPVSDVFNAIGDCRIGEFGGRRYLEAGSNANDRFALRFRLDAGSPLHCIEIDYPDDAVRTADLIVQSCRGPLPEAVGSSDYVMQVGYAIGDEYPNTGTVLTHRCLYWTRSDDVALVAMTARKNRRAAVCAVRVYRVKSGGLPAARMSEPMADGKGVGRSFALYYEDPAISGDFARTGNRADTAAELIDRVASLMKYTGQNILCYPGVWYQGMIGPDYMPRPHPPFYREAYYTAFDREGLGFMPTLNPNEMELPGDLITAQSVKDGSLHPTPVNILATGEPNPGGWHSTPPNYNVLHPDWQRQVFAWFDDLIAEGVSHHSFRGLCLHLTRHSPLWFGDRRSGFNDYAVEAFSRDCGIEIPDRIDRSAALRGKSYADWITNSCEKAWLDWRCRQVAAFWRRLAGKLSAARSDLKLMINTFLVIRPVDAEFGRADTIELGNRYAGFDPGLLRDVENIIVCQSVLPADYRWFRDVQYGGGDIGRKTAYQRAYYLRRDDFSMVRHAAYPWVNQHDRYWESAVGNRARSSSTLDCAWMSELGWRVSTVNPSGRHALRQYALPLRYNDVLGVSKGGFLIGTYGSEEVLVPWVQAFRSLPAVKMQDCGGDEFAKVRTCEFGGKTYFYVINTDRNPRMVSFDFPEGTIEILTGKSLSGNVHLHLAAYELRSYVRGAVRQEAR